MNMFSFLGSQWSLEQNNPVAGKFLELIEVWELAKVWTPFHFWTKHGVFLFDNYESLTKPMESPSRFSKQIDKESWLKSILALVRWDFRNTLKTFAYLCAGARMAKTNRYTYKYIHKKLIKDLRQTISTEKCRWYSWVLRQIH